MGDLVLIDGMNCEMVGANTATPNGTALALPTPPAWGAWTQLIAATARAATGLMFCFHNTGQGNTAFALGIGAAGAEQVLIPGVLLFPQDEMMQAYFPIAVPAGSRLSAQYWTNNAGSPYATCLLLEEGLGSPPGGSRVTAYGADPTTFGTQATAPNTANTKGVWTEVVASTAHRCSQLMVDAAGGTLTQYLDIGVGAAGSEQVYLSNLPIGTTGTTQTSFKVTLPVSIPQGSRIAVRNQANQIGGTAQTYVALYGIE
jgi:hypothetical protein